MPAERAFRAMGTDAHLIVVGGTSDLIEQGARRIADLEQKWTRFVPESEVSMLTAHAGTAVPVSSDTIELVNRAREAWRMTRGLFDPTMLGAVIRAGYDRSFEDVRRDPRPGTSELHAGASGIEIDGNHVRLPAGTGFDPGGIGKGLAADIVAGELRAAGAAGVCVNIGGDVRVSGDAPDTARGAGWTIAIDHPWCATPLALLGIREGAAATSTTLRRRWTIGGATRHHLIDPATGQPAASTLVFATVVGGAAWAAEVVAKALLIRGAPEHFSLLRRSGAEALVVDDAGRVDTTFGLAAYLGDGALPPVVLPPASALAPAPSSGAAR